MGERMGAIQRMRLSGWYDVLWKLLLLALVLGICALIGLISYNSAAAGFTAEMGAYERRQALNWFARSRGALSALALGIGGFCALGFLMIRFLTPYIERELSRQKAVRRAGVVLQTVFATLVSLIMVFPIYWMIISSFKATDELLLPTPSLWPETWVLHNYPNILRRAPFGLYFFNTLVSTFFIMLFQMSIGILAAYGFSKGEFRMKNTLFLVVLGALMIPIQVTFVPIYVLVAKLGWLNSFPGLIVPNMVSAYFIFMLRQSFMSVDNSYLDAGKVDGMGRIGSIVHILMPMCKPTLITVSIITFINGWNSYFWPKIITTNDSRRTLAVGINYIRQTFAGVEISNYNEIMAAAMLAILPIVVLFLVLQRFIMTGLSKASMK